jgi:hypothetical protein
MVTPQQAATLARLRAEDGFAGDQLTPEELYAHRTKPCVLPFNYWVGTGLVCVRIGTTGNVLPPKFSS